MKKYSIALFAAALAIVSGCRDYSYESWTPDETLHRTGEVTLLATFENLQTKVFMDENGHGTWDGGDEIAVACSDGSFVNFKLDGTGDTRRATFKGTIPDGKQLGTVAVYPASAAMSLDNSGLAVNVPGSYKAAVSSTYPGVLVGAIGDSWQVDFKQALGFLRLTLTNFPADAVKIAVSSPEGALSGTFKAPVADILERGLKPSDAVSGSGSELLVPSAGKTVYAFLPVPVADYSSLDAVLTDSKGREVMTQALSEYATGVSRAELHAMTVALAETKAPPCRINLGGERMSINESAPGVFESEFEIPASTSFTVEFDGVPYGFATGSGAGGLGTITSENSALPVGAISAAGKSKVKYYVKRAIGTLASTEIANNPFTVNLVSPGKMAVRFDNSDPAVPKYNIRLVEADDPKLIFHEDFDLCTQGGDYMAPAAGRGSKVDAYDGYLPATGTVTQNNGSFPFDYPTQVSNNGATPLAREDYMKAYELQDWIFVYAVERPSGLQLCSGSVAGSMTTPVFEKAGNGTDAIIEIDIARFSTSSVDPVFFRLEGAGKFTAASVTRDAYTSAKLGSSFPEASKNYTEFEDGGAAFKAVDDEFFPHSADNADVDKPVSHYRLEASGITSATKIKIDCPKGAKNAPRIFVFDIKVTKK